MKNKVVLFILMLLCCNTLFSQTTLKDALKGKFYIGTALNLQQISGKDVAGVNVIKQNFDAIVAENCMKSMYLQPREGEFNFADADQFVTFGEQNGMWITGHCLIWHSQLPRWFFVDANGNDFNTHRKPTPKPNCITMITTNGIRENAQQLSG